jgi:hypothetical protein
MRSYTKRVRLHPCRLEKPDLLRLVEIVEEVIPVSEIKQHFRISTDLPTIKIEENSVEDFLKHGDLPNKLNELSILIFRLNESGETERSVYLSFTSTYIVVSVEGLDETWVLGKFEQITQFLKEKRPWFWALSGAFPYIFSIVLTLSVISAIFLIRAQQIIPVVFMTIFFIATVFASVFHVKGTFLPYTQVILTPKEGFLNKQNITFIIAILTLVVAIIEVVR